MANEFRKVTDANGVDHPVTDDNRVDWESYAKTGVHQLLPLTLSYIKSLNTGGSNVWNGNVLTRNSVALTFVTDSAGNVTEITTSGTSTGDSSINLYNTATKCPAIGNRVTFKGCPANGSSSSYYINLYRVGTVDGSGGSYDDLGSGVTFDFLNNGSGTVGAISIQIRNGTNMNDKSFKPLLKFVNDTSDDITSYAMTNRELTEKVQGIIDAATNAADFAAFKTAIGNL